MRVRGSTLRGPFLSDQSEESKLSQQTKDTALMKEVAKRQLLQTSAPLRAQFMENLKKVMKQSMSADPVTCLARASIFGVFLCLLVSLGPYLRGLKVHWAQRFPRKTSFSRDFTEIKTTFS